MVQLQIHMSQRLLHVLDVRGRVLQMPVADPHVSPQRRNVARRAEAGTQQAACVKALQPLRIVDIALAPGYGLALTRIGQDCPRRSQFDPPCRSQLDPGMGAGGLAAGCG